VSTATVNPLFIRASAAQLGALHRAIAARGIHTRLGVSVHEAARHLAGVASLTELSTVRASKLLDSINGHSPVGGGRHLPRARAGVLRLATIRQRAAIAGLFDELKWPAEECAAWLKDRHDVDNLQTAAISTRTASQIILQLEAVLLKRGRGG